MNEDLKAAGQMKLPIDYFREPDRNFEKGGRSFYFFDFDDNVIHLPTKILLFHKITGKELEVSTMEFAHFNDPELKKKFPQWDEYTVSFDPSVGSFRNFREQSKERLSKGKEQPIIEDMKSALANPFLEWRGPSWDFFQYAVDNNRPISIITARGHHPHTIRRAINMLVQSRDLGAHPNYLSIYPVSHTETARYLGDSEFSPLNTAELKKRAIKAAVKDAFECYGESPYHRFGMSDDDPQNVALILEAMKELKEIYPDNAFFVINTHGRKLIKEEVLLDGNIKAKLLGEEKNPTSSEEEQEKLI